MTTKVIDGAFTGASFPATYVGPGTLVGNIVSDGGVRQRTTGKFSSTGDDVRIMLGYQPRSIEIVNETDVIVWKKTSNLAAANTLKLNGTGPAFTLDTASLITFEDGGAGNFNVLISATLLGTSKAISFEIGG
jgi:hypothetical protein